MQKVACIHLYNDFSGSPAVLKNIINGFVESRMQVTVITNQSVGKLSNIKNVLYDTFNYSFKENKFLRILNLLNAQIKIFYKVLLLPRDYTIYINTVLPFGAAIAGFISGKKVIYHVHETTMKPKFFKQFLFGIVNKTAEKVIYVSQFVADAEPLALPKSKVIYNALSKNMLAELRKIKTDFTKAKNVLMVCSLKDYKGIPEFLKLSKALPKYSFTLVCNANKKEIEQYFSDKEIPGNLEIFDAQKSVIPFYEKASLLVNLSRNKEWIETFGLTLLEAMHAGIPVIGQTVGGNAEILENGKYGFCLIGNAIVKLKTIVTMLLEDKVLYEKMAKLALTRAKDFEVEKQISSIISFAFSTEEIRNTIKLNQVIAEYK